MDTAESKLDSFLSILFRPRLLLQGCVEFASAWLFTRKWLVGALLNTPLLLLGGAALVLTVWGTFLGDNVLVERYNGWIQEEMPRTLASLEEESNVTEDSAESGGTKETDNGDSGQEDDVEASSDSEGDESQGASEENVEEEEVTEYGQLLLRRLLQLRNENSRVTYLVAAQLANKGRIGQARQMMRRIAPEGGGGFAPGHAWLAAETLSKKTALEPEQVESLSADLNAARQWQGTSSTLLGYYARLLETQGKVNEALQVLDEGSKTAPELGVLHADMAARNDRKQSLDRTLSKQKSAIRDRMEAGEANASDMVNLINLFLIDKEPDRALLAIKNAQKNQLINEENANLFKRLQSNAYLLQYRKSAVFEGANASVNLALIDAALKSDPSNPEVGQEIARLIAAGQGAPPAFQEALQKQLASGQATAITHILLANRQLQDGKITSAIPHLQIALAQAPNSPMVMNNLGLAIALTDESQVERALQLSQKAVDLEPNNAEYQDTLGQIRKISGDLFGAVSAYEAAIGIDGNRVKTRELLIEVYDELQMQDMVKAQRAEVAKLRK